MHVLAVVRGSKIRGAGSSFEAAGSLICLDTCLALDVGAANLPPRKQDMLAVAAILVAELLEQIALFQPDTDQNVAGDQHREQEMTNGHRRRGPDREQDAEIEG